MTTYDNWKRKIKVKNGFYNKLIWVSRCFNRLLNGFRFITRVRHLTLQWLNFIGCQIDGIIMVRGRALSSSCSTALKYFQYPAEIHPLLSFYFISSLILSFYFLSVPPLSWGTSSSFLLRLKDFIHADESVVLVAKTLRSGS